MGAFFSAVIPNGQVEVDASSSDYACPANTIALRINDVSAGTVVQVETVNGDSVTYDNLANGMELVGHFQLIDATATTCDSVIVLYVDR